MKKLFFLFVYTCCMANILPLLFPFLHILYFVPFIVIAFYRSPLNQALWWSFGCGLLFDLYSSQTRLGIYAFNYCLVTYFLYGYRTRFFEDRFSTLPVMIFCYACLSNTLQSAFLFAIGAPFRFSWEWVQTDLFFIPLLTSIYGFIIFEGAVALYQRLSMRFFPRR